MTGLVSTFNKTGEILNPEAQSSRKTVKTSKNQGFFRTQNARNGATFGGHSSEAFHTVFVPSNRAATDPRCIRGRNAALQGLKSPPSAGFGSLELP